MYKLFFLATTICYEPLSQVHVANLTSGLPSLVSLHLGKLELCIELAI